MIHQNRNLKKKCVTIVKNRSVRKQIYYRPRCSPIILDVFHKITDFPFSSKDQLNPTITKYAQKSDTENLEDNIQFFTLTEVTLIYVINPRIPSISLWCPYDILPNICVVRKHLVDIDHNLHCSRIFSRFSICIILRQVGGCNRFSL